MWKEQKLIQGGHIYIKNKKTDDKVLGKWDQSRNMKYCAHIHTIWEQILLCLNEHNHAGDAARCKVAVVISNDKNRAKITQDVYTNLSQDIAGKMSMISTMKRIIRYVRNLENCVPANPTSLETIQIPNIYQITNAGEQFLLFDNHDDQNWIFIFSTKKNLAWLSQRKKLVRRWYIQDSTIII